MTISNELLKKNLSNDLINKFKSLIIYPNDLKNDCWFFNYCKNNDGYYSFVFNKITYLAHRLSYVIYINDIYENEIIIHSCRNKCINPFHIKKGNHQDNTLDKFKDNTIVYGEDIFTSKLNDNIILTILDNCYNYKFSSMKEIADFYNVSESTIFSILHGKSWVRVTQDYPISLNIIRERILKHPNKHKNSPTFTKKEVYNIKDRLSKGEKCKDIANFLNVSYNTIYCIKVGKTWKNVSYP